MTWKTHAAHLEIRMDEERHVTQLILAHAVGCVATQARRHFLEELLVPHHTYEVDGTAEVGAQPHDEVVR